MLNRTPFHPKLFALALGLAMAPFVTTAAVHVLYSTGFESGEGFDAAYELPGQDGWLGYPYYTNVTATNASGIIANTDTPPSQEAYVGFFAPNPQRSSVTVWKPVNHIPDDKPIVTFEVLMTITTSSESRPNLDDFRWSIYNMEGDRLFSVDFDNFYLDVSYRLDGSPTNVVTDTLFTNDVPFQFSLSMDFQSNQWSAAIDGNTFLADLPITSSNAPLNLGDVDAVWAIFDTNTPGDNYMIFDNYRITAAPRGTDSAWLQPLGRAGDYFLLRLHGPEQCSYALEVSTNTVGWTALKTNVVTGGYSDYVDAPLDAAPMRLYRARLVP